MEASAREKGRPLYNTPKSWDERAKAYESDHEACGWSEQGQEARFRAVLDMLDESRRVAPGDVLLDYGCGTAAFKSWLSPALRYIGYDWSIEMRERARERAIIKDSLEGLLSVDHVVAIGVFNLRDNWWKQRTWDTLSALWDLTAKTMIVSFYRGDDPRCLSYGPMDLGATVHQLGVRDFVIDGSYLDNDLMLAVRR